jgi:DNA-nicking Smr family endonuclease
MKRAVTDEERDLFLAALSGRLPAKRPRAKAAKSAPVKAVKPLKKISEKPAESAPVLRGRRQTTSDEEELFLITISGRAPVKQAAAAAKTKAPAPPSTAKHQKSSVGVDGNTSRKLTRGEIAPTAKLDLHGMTESAAHGALTAFLLSAHRRGDRLVLVVTGKGAGGAGVLRQMVPRWIDEAPMATIIAEKRLSHRRHGGDGALYVYLRKRPQQSAKA